MLFPSSPSGLVLFLLSLFRFSSRRARTPSMCAPAFLLSPPARATVLAIGSTSHAHSDFTFSVLRIQEQRNDLGVMSKKDKDYD